MSATATTETILKWLESQQSPLLDLIQEWSAINTCSSNCKGIDQFSRRLEKSFARFNAEIKRIPLSDRSVMNNRGELHQLPVADALSIVKRPEAPYQILFCGHMDTVFPEASSFQSSRIEGDRLIGPGVADMKGGIALMLVLLETMEKFCFTEKIGWEVFLNPDEELGSPSSVIELQRRASRAQLGLVFEPTLPDGALVSERMGSINMTVLIRGKSAHAGRNLHEGKSAIMAALPLIDAMSKWAESHRPDLLFNIGTLHAGTAANTVPDTAVIGINVRSRSPSLLQQALVSIECLVSDFCCKEPGCYQFHLNTSRSPKDLDGPTEGLLNLYRESGHELGVETTWRATGGVCDGNTLAAVGLPTLDTLGVVGDNLHTENEYLAISKLLQKAQHNALFVNTICQNWLSKGD